MKSTLLLAAAAMIAMGANTANADVHVDVHDQNGDGVVTFQEVVDFHDSSISRSQAFMDRHRAVFDGADANKDGVVDRSESQGDGSGGKTKSHNKKS